MYKIKWMLLILLFLITNSSLGYSFFDSFEDNDISDWESRCWPGNWSVANGTVYGSTSTSPTFLVPINATEFQNGTITLKAGCTHVVGISARIDESDSGIYAYVSPDHNVARIRLSYNGLQSTIYNSLYADFPNETYILTLICDDSELSLFIQVPATGESWLLNATDPFPKSGTFGFHMGDEPNAYWEWITAIDNPTGTEDPTQQSISVSTDFSVSNNPFSSSLTFFYQINNSNNSSLDIFDSSGRLIQTINVTADGNQQSINWDGRNSSGSYITPGVYFAKLRGLDETTIRLIKI